MLSCETALKLEKTITNDIIIIVIVFLRLLGTTEHPVKTVFYFMLIATTACALKK